MPIHINVAYEDIEYVIDVICKHTKTHQEVATSSRWSDELQNSQDISGVVTVCDSCDERIEPNEEEECQA